MDEGGLGVLKRVLILECGRGFGGALTSLASFLDAVAHGKWEFHVLTGYPQTVIQESEIVRKVRVLKRNRLYGPSAPFEKKIRKIFGSFSGKIAFVADFFTTNLLYALHVYRYARRHGIHLIHLNNGVLINDGGLVGAVLSRIPRIVHVRGLEYKSRTSAGYAKLVHRFLPVSRFVADTVLGLGASPERIRIVYEGLDAEAFANGANGARVRRELGLDAEDLVVGMVGCLVPWKGHAVFLEACEKVSRNRDAVFLVAGDSPEQDPAALERLKSRARFLGIEERVRFLGHRADVASVMDACDVVVHASTEPEPFGRVILEGMALEKPVVATRGGGPSEVVAENADGFLVAPGSPEELEKAMLYLLENPSVRRKMGVRGRNHARDSFSVVRHAEKILEVYQDVLNDKEN
jgi:glycosyltransferase involved in cell wall biosynthesis